VGRWAADRYTEGGGGAVRVGKGPMPGAVVAYGGDMVPFGTPPNGIVCGTGKIQIKEMALKGFVMNMISIVVIILVVYFLVPPILGIDITQSLPIKN
ncbi:anion permease, partial [Staphylococcus chromogenes]